MPRGLFWRAFLIMFIPLILVQATVVYIFYERHWDTVSHQLAIGCQRRCPLHHAHGGRRDRPRRARPDRRDRPAGDAVRRRLRGWRRAARRGSAAERWHLLRNAASAARPAHRGPLPPRQHSARQGDDNSGPAAGRCVDPGDDDQALAGIDHRPALPVDGRDGARGDDDRRPVPAQPGSSDQAAGGCRRRAGQGPAGERPQARRRVRGPSRGRRLPGDAGADSASDRAAHRDAGRGLSRSSHAADPGAAAARHAGRCAPRTRGPRSANPSRTCCSWST